MDYVIAIPSYKRQHALKTHTLRCLENIDIDRIHIFVANDEEYANYKAALPDYKIIVGSEGLKNQRNFISLYFPLDTKIISIDDDIQDFMIKKDNSFERIDNIEDYFVKGFMKCEEHNASLFGFYPVLNGMFMKYSITTDFRFIIGSCYGYINRRRLVSISQKEDYETSILNYLADKKVVRINFISMKTKYYKMKGGLQSFSNRLQEQKEAVNYLIEKYPEYFALKKSFRSGFPELRVKKLKN